MPIYYSIMKRIYSILALGSVLAGSTNSTQAGPWGRVNYTVFSRFEVVFGEPDFQYLKNSKQTNEIHIPAGVTHVFLKLQKPYQLIEFPESVRVVNKDIFGKFQPQILLMSDKTARNLLRGNQGKNGEEDIRGYFSLDDSCDIMIRESAIVQNAPHKEELSDLHLKVEPKNEGLDGTHNFDKNNLKKSDPKKGGFLDQIKNFDPKQRLKHVTDDQKSKSEDAFVSEPKNSARTPQLKHVTDDQKNTYNAPKNPFLNELENFDRNKLKKHEPNSSNAPKPQKIEESGDLVDALRKAMDKRRPAMEDDNDENDEQDVNIWDD